MNEQIIQTFRHLPSPGTVTARFVCRSSRLKGATAVLQFTACVLLGEVKCSLFIYFVCFMALEAVAGPLKQAKA